MTHELYRNIIGLSNLKIKKVVITKIKNNTYYALVYIDQNGKEITEDARPSDGLAIALKFKVPIYASEKVIEEVKKINLSLTMHEALNKSEEGKRRQSILESLNPDDYGKWKMQNEIKNKTAIFSPLPLFI